MGTSFRRTYGHFSSFDFEAGTFVGSVTSFDAKTEKYTVRYFNGEKDSLTWGQLAQHLMVAGSTVDVARPPLKVGTTFSKTFPGEGTFEGVVVDFDAESNLHHVRYTDGDEEDLDTDEIYACVMASTANGDEEVHVASEYEQVREGNIQRNNEFLQSLGLLDTAPPSSTEASAPQHSPINTRPPMKVGTIFFKTFPGEGTFEGVVVDFDAESNLHHVRYTDGDEEDLDTDEIYACVMASTTKGLMNARPAMTVGTIFFKTFPGYGTFEGVVVSFNAESNLYHVRYTDGDEEDLDTDAIYACLQSTLCDSIANARGTRFNRKLPGKNFTAKEDAAIIAARAEFKEEGKKIMRPTWELIAKRVPGRTVQQVKNRWGNLCARHGVCDSKDIKLVQRPLKLKKLFKTPEEGYIKLRELAFSSLDQFWEDWSRDEAKQLHVEALLEGCDFLCVGPEDIFKNEISWSQLIEQLRKQLLKRDLNVANAQKMSDVMQGLVTQAQTKRARNT
jgi:hypothetical protein